MRSPISILIYLSVLLIFSCKSNCTSDAEDIMGDWFQKKLIITPGWKLLNPGATLTADIIDVEKPNSAYYVLHYFDADCDKCIGNLVDAKKFIAKNKEKFPGLKYVFVGTGSTDIYLKDAINKTKFNHQVYFEKKYSEFKKVNKIPFDNERFYRTMLVDQNNRLVLFGSLYDNEKAEELYAQITNCQQ